MYVSIRQSRFWKGGILVAKFVEYFDFYEDDWYYQLWFTGKIYMMQRGIVSQHVQLPARRVTKSYYMEQREKYYEK